MSFWGLKIVGIKQEALNLQFLITRFKSKKNKTEHYGKEQAYTLLEIFRND